MEVSDEFPRLHATIGPQKGGSSHWPSRGVNVLSCPLLRTSQAGSICAESLLGVWGPRDTKWWSRRLAERRKKHGNMWSSNKDAIRWLPSQVGWRPSLQHFASEMCFLGKIKRSHFNMTASQMAHSPVPSNPPKILNSISTFTFWDCPTGRWMQVVFWLPITPWFSTVLGTKDLVRQSAQVVPCILKKPTRNCCRKKRVSSVLIFSSWALPCRASSSWQFQLDVLTQTSAIPPCWMKNWE